jgi:hypothetical protein
LQALSVSSIASFGNTWFCVLRTDSFHRAIAHSRNHLQRFKEPQVSGTRQLYCLNSFYFKMGLTGRLH